jgi:hypothetical protein
MGWCSQMTFGSDPREQKELPPPDPMRGRFSTGRGANVAITRMGRASMAVRLLYFWRFLRTALSIGIERLWTVHNMEPHEGAYRWDRYG